MSTANKVLVYRWFEEVWNQKREPAIFEMLHPDAAIFGLGEAPTQAIRGPMEFIPFWRRFITAIPNLTVAVESTVAEDEKVVARCSVRGKHTGEGFGPPTSKLVAFTGMCLVHVKDGKLFEGWNNFDFFMLYQQLGIVTVQQP